ncbi:unnamed protein product [Onchocerca ochengi]|uniref:Fibronectin type-III domain-containing protein n=1 Tax=Onchocerca ochengi TaxID=42157 RepID=A0A182DY17_ONCOC|nr:unnamed protein product [Onchocerca ochengi]
MTDKNILESVMDSAGLTAENVQNVREMGNDLIDKLSEEIEEGTKSFDELKNEMDKATSDVLLAAEKMVHGTEDEVTEMLKKTKEKLDDSVNDVDCDFSGVISNLKTFSNEIQEKASENLGDIKDKMNKFAENIGKTVPEIASKSEELIERRTENVLGAMDNNSELFEDADGRVSEIFTGFEESCKVAVTGKLGEAMNKNVDGANSEKIDAFEKFDSEINEKSADKLEKEDGKIDEFIKETFGEFQKLNEKADNNTMVVEEIGREKLEDFKEGINEKVNEINIRTSSEEDIIHGSDDGEKGIVKISDICVAENDNDMKKDEFSKENPVDAISDLLGVEGTVNLRSNTSNEDNEKMEEVTEEIASKPKHDKETQAIKKIIPAGENVPEQVGTLSETGIYHDDYEPEKPGDIVTTKLGDFVNDKVDEADKLLEEVFNVNRKLKEPEVVAVAAQEDVTHQKETEKTDTVIDIVGEVLQKGREKKELHDVMIDLSDCSTATSDSKSETRIIGDEEQKSANASPQLPPIPGQNKELNPANESEPVVLQYPEITESLNIASENTDKKEPEFKHSSEVTLESSFVLGKSTDQEKTELEIKPIPDPMHSKGNVAHFTDEVAVNINKMFEFPSSNTIPSSFQSSTPEENLEFSMTAVALESTLQKTVPMKVDDQDKTIIEAEIKPVQEKTESKFQSTKTNFAEKSVNLGGPPNHAPPLSPENTVSVLPSPKNVPPPVPPKKKSIEMILAEEAKAMGQHSLRGIETSVQGITSPEIEKNELKSRNKTKQNIETSIIQEQTEVAADKNEKRETMQEPESQKTHITQIQKPGTQKERVHPIPPTTESKSEAASQKNKTDTMRQKSGDGQQQQTRRCTIL